MEFHEKLQELRHSRSLTQEELAEALYVSRAAISKWESGRGYPSIDSLKEISRYFSVSIDDLLSGEKLLFIAEKENRANIHRLCHWLFGVVDLFSLLLILLPLYPNPVGNHVYSVNLPSYSQASPAILRLYWLLFLMLFSCGAVKMLLTNVENEKGSKITTCLSMLLSTVIVLFLALSREPYALIIAFLLLMIKGILLLKLAKAGG